jgi:hypothetical protein
MLSEAVHWNLGGRLADEGEAKGGECGLFKRELMVDSGKVVAVSSDHAKVRVSLVSIKLWHVILGDGDALGFVPLIVSILMSLRCKVDGSNFLESS